MPQLLAAWSVHLYTASGSVLGLLVVIAAFQGESVRALWLLLAALFVDGTDGMLARRVRVKEHIPWFDGARLDDIVDYLTYVFAPVVLLWSGGYLPGGNLGIALAMAPLLASSFQFCRIDAKTEDHFFLGFPDYWNVIAFYTVVVGLSATTLAVILLVCSVLVFVPIGYVYPSRTVAFRGPTLVLTAVWLVAYAVILAQMPDPSLGWVAVSLLYLVYYVGLSLYLTSSRHRRSRREAGVVTRHPAQLGAATAPE